MHEILDRHTQPQDTHAAVDAELARERAAALGRAGRALSEALDAYRAATDAAPLSPDEEAALVDRAAASLYRLLLQRECAGARSDNLQAIRAAYDVPDVVLRRL